ncbi:MAG: hypothetical protein WBC92_18915 [Terracidiphilus sp.]
MKSAMAQVARATRLFAVSAVFLAAASVSSQTAPTSSSPQDQQPHGQVIFSRSTDENGQTTTTTPTSPQTDVPSDRPSTPGRQQAGQSVAAPTATDAERRAVTFTAFDLDVHLRSAERYIAVRALLAVRNDGKTPLTCVPLQISSSLNWERIRIGSRDVPFTVAMLNSDIDHTGQLHEAAVPLATPLDPGATLQLDVTYSGTIVQSAQRLLAIGTPPELALNSDWDAIGVDFTGLRGFGNVVWYPVSSVPVLLGNGARVFDEMGEHKLRVAGARFSLRLTDEFPHGQPPTVALINGQPAQLSVTDSATAEVSGVATASLENSTLGFEAPSLFIAIRTAHQASNTTLWTLPTNEAAVPAWVSAEATVTPFLQSWLGQTPRSQLTILDLPDPQDASFETGSLLATAIHQSTPDQLTGILAHALAHAWMNSPRAYLSEGVAHFIGTLWLEKQSGRQKALEALESGRMALALAEPSSPGVSAGQPLAQAISPVFYRTKATYVFWMLRDLVGDPALSAALRAYDPAADTAHGLGPNSGSGMLQKLIEQAGGAQQGSDDSSSLGSQAGLRSDLSWFFSDWVNNDRGLPDISISSVFPTQAAVPPPPTPHSSKSSTSALPGPTASEEISGPEAGMWFVAVNLSNSGYAAAEIPITVSNADTSVTQRVLVPARGKATQRILIQGRPTQVQANDGTVPETEASIHITHLIDTSASSSSAPAVGVVQ